MRKEESKTQTVPVSQQEQKAKIKAAEHAVIPGMDGDGPLCPEAEVMSCTKLLSLPGVQDSAELAALLNDDLNTARVLIGGE